MRAYAAINRLRHRFLTYGRVAAWSPSIQGPGGTVLRDYSGRGNDGTLTNMDPATDWVVSSGREALDIETNDYISLTKGYSPGKKAMSVAGWAKFDSLAASMPIYTETINGNSATNRLSLAVTASGEARLAGRANDGDSFTVFALGNSGTVVTGKWCHIIGVYDANTGNHKVYVNGRDDTASTTGGTVAFDSDAPDVVVIGWNAVSNYLNGCLGGVDIWNRVISPYEAQVLALRPDVIYEEDEVSPYATQWGSVATAEAAFQAAWGANATTIAGVASGQ